MVHFFKLYWTKAESLKTFDLNVFGGNDDTWPTKSHKFLSVVGDNLVIFMISTTDIDSSNVFERPPQQVSTLGVSLLQLVIYLSHGFPWRDRFEFLGVKAFPTAPDVVDHALHMHYEAHLQ